MTTNDSHIATEALFESARLHAELDAVAAQHLADCDLCRNRLSWMEVATSLGRQEAAFEPPEPVMDNVLRMGRSPGVFKQLRNFIVASITFDSFGALAPAGVRRAEAAARQMTFEAENLEISLSLQRSGNRLTLTGQVLDKASAPIAEPAAKIDVVLEGDHVAGSTLSPWGEFVFPDLPAAEYALHLSIPGRTIRIPFPSS